MTDDLYVDAREAAGMLGVSVATLYAYVSRKGLRSFPTPGQRTRRYWRSDILALLSGPARTASGPLVARETAVTLLTDTDTYYRGISATVLADSWSTEAVAAHLWRGDALSEIFTDRLAHTPSNFSAVSAALDGASPHDKALSLLPLIERANPRAFDLSPESFRRSGADAMRWLAALITEAAGPSTRPLHEFIAETCDADVAVADLVRRAVILVADHEFGLTTHAVRAAAGAGVTPYSAVLVGLIAGGGQKVRVQRTEAVRRLLGDILGSNSPEEMVIRLLRAGEFIPGYEPLAQHVTEDRRATAMMQATAAAFPEDEEFDRLSRASAMVLDVTGQEPGLIVPLLFLGKKLKLRDEIGIGTIGRAIGWIAHALEQLQDQRPSRPAANYVGPLPI